MQAMSSGSPGRSIGVLASNSSRSASSVSTIASPAVATPPTPIALTRTRGASSTARLRVIWFSAALPAP